MSPPNVPVIGWGVNPVEHLPQPTNRSSISESAGGYENDEFYSRRRNGETVDGAINHALRCSWPDGRLCVRALLSCGIRSTTTATHRGTGDGHRLYHLASGDRFSPGHGANNQWGDGHGAHARGSQFCDRDAGASGGAAGSAERTTLE